MNWHLVSYNLWQNQQFFCRVNDDDELNIWRIFALAF